MELQDKHQSSGISAICLTLCPVRPKSLNVSLLPEAFFVLHRSTSRRCQAPSLSSSRAPPVT